MATYAKGLPRVYALQGGSLFEKTKVHKNSFYNVKILKFFGTMGSMVVNSMHKKMKIHINTSSPTYFKYIHF
jgi:hypothetical protein